jgi:hypothetical protein
LIEADAVWPNAALPATAVTASGTIIVGGAGDPFTLTTGVAGEAGTATGPVAAACAIGLAGLPIATVRTLVHGTPRADASLAGVIPCGAGVACAAGRTSLGRGWGAVASFRVTSARILTRLSGARDSGAAVGPADIIGTLDEPGAARGATGGGAFGRNAAVTGVADFARITTGAARPTANSTGGGIGDVTRLVPGATAVSAARGVTDALPANTAQPIATGVASGCRVRDALARCGIANLADRTDATVAGSAVHHLLAVVPDPAALARAGPGDRLWFALLVLLLLLPLFPGIDIAAVFRAPRPGFYLVESETAQRTPDDRERGQETDQLAPGVPVGEHSRQGIKMSCVHAGLTRLSAGVSPGSDQHSTHHCAHPVSLRASVLSTHVSSIYRKSYFLSCRGDRGSVVRPPGEHRERSRLTGARGADANVPGRAWVTGGSARRGRQQGRTEACVQRLHVMQRWFVPHALVSSPCLIRVLHRCPSQANPLIQPDRVGPGTLPGSVNDDDPDVGPTMSANREGAVRDVRAML